MPSAYLLLWNICSNLMPLILLLCYDFNIFYIFFIRHMLWYFFLIGCGFSFHSLKNILQRVKALILMKPNLSFFFFFFFYKQYLRNSQLTLRPQRFSPGVFIILGFIFRSMIHLDWFLYMGSFFFFFASGYELFQHHLLKRESFIHWIIWVFVKNQLSTYVWLYFWTLFCSTDLFVYLYINTTLFWLL